MRALVLGASGMLGSAMLRVLSEKGDWETFGAVRDESVKRFFPAPIGERLLAGIDVEREDSLVRTFDRIGPNVVVNCVGLIKHKPDAEDPLLAVPINTLLPHRLAALCKLAGARLIHVSTDCVFSGEKGGYVEDDVTDARDVYGKSKALGEVRYPHSVTLRTSIIGHELQGAKSLLEWFLSQEGRCKGFTRAVFSGLPTVAFAQLVRDVVIPHTELSGLYHVAAKPIAKYDLLKLIARVYGKTIDIAPDDTLRIDRSLNAERFRLATGYVAPEWPELIELMHAYK
jgi:dTDP-4-dehydrorhamnose reductase